MKRVVALVLALAMLLACTAACAESSGTRIRLRKIRIRQINWGNQMTARLRDMDFYISIGVAEGVPTLQFTLDYGDEQELDCVIQMAGSQLLLCLGGISGTYYVNMDELFEEPGQGALMAAAFGTALQMFGADPNAVMKAAMPKDENKAYTFRFELSMDKCRDVIERMLDVLDDSEMIEAAEVQRMRAFISRSDAPIEFEIHYKPKSKWTRIYLLREGKGVEVFARTKQTTGELELINVSGDAVKYNLMDMDQATMDELYSELEFLGMKVNAFMNTTSLKDLMD